MIPVLLRAGSDRMPRAGSLDIPVDPGVEEARDRLARELLDRAYREAEPTFFDEAVAWLLDRLGELFEQVAPGTPPLGWTLLALLLLGGVAWAYVLYGPPRLTRRSAAGALFGSDDERDAAELRRRAAAAADAGDWAEATCEMYRAVARNLVERELLRTSPGTTAAAFAARAAVLFPALGDDLVTAATHFDDVRYLGRPGSEPAYRDVVALESRVRATRPLLEGVRPA